MLRHRVKSLTRRVSDACPAPLPPEQIKQLILPYNGRDEPLPGRYRISPCCDLIIVPADCTDDEAAADAMPRGRL